jgi:multidrug efflux pump subunit AcrB/rhodanese-related sulfurtransferase
VKITSYAVRKRLAACAIITTAVVLGVYGLLRLPVEFLPKITYPMIKVHIWWSGATPEEIDRSLADPIERQMATVDNLDYLESSSIEGMYTLQVNFKYGVNVDAAYQDALAAMARVARELPKDIEPPVVIKADPSQLPVVQLTVSSDQSNLVELRTWVDEWLQDQLLAVAGVAGAEIVGGLKREIRVHLNPDALDKYSISLNDVLRRLQEENIEQFGGRVTVGAKEIIARTVGEYKSLDEIRNVLLTRDRQAKVYLRDVAEVLDSHEETRVITRLDGNPCVKLSVLKQADANMVQVAKAVSRRLAELKPLLPEGVALGMVENQADYVEAALKGVQSTAVETALLVVVIVWLFLGSWRQMLVIAFALPLTLVMNFGLMQLAGFSLNIFSLGGLVIAIGVLVDNSIIVIETITRRRQENQEISASETVIAAAGEVGTSLVASTLSFMALFAPFLLVPGLVSLLFRELILVIAGIVALGLLVAVSVTPMISAALLGKRKQQSRLTLFERFFSGVTEAYGWMLDKILRGRWIAIPAFVLLLALAAVSFRSLGGEFLPQMDDGRIMVKVKMPTGAALAETDRVLAEIERKISGDEQIESLFTLAGGKVWGLYTYEIANEGELNIQLVPRHMRRMSTEEYISQLRPVVGKVKIPGGNAMVMQMKIKGVRSLGDADIEVKIKGQNIKRLHELAQKTAGLMNGLKYFTNVYVSMDMTKPEYQVRPDRTRAAELGVSISSLAGAMRSLISGAVATSLRDGDESYDIRVKIPEKLMTTRQDVENLPLESKTGGYLRLKDVAEVRQSVGPVEIVRENQIKQVIVRGDAAGVSVGQALEELVAAMEKIDRPPGYDFLYGGQAQMMADMRQTLTAVFLFALFFSFIVLAVQFNNLRFPFIILGSVPFCLAGVVFIMHAAEAPLGATVIIGVLVVIAAAINDGVLLLTFADEIKEQEGLDSHAAVLYSAKIRLRPRVMTTINGVGKNKTTGDGYMKQLVFIFLLAAMCRPAYSSDAGLEQYIAAFDYTTGKEMKIDSKELVQLLKEGKAQLIDIRFAEEYSAWKVMPSMNIPLNQLPARLAELDKTKIIVTACPHKDRATVAMVYLRSKGIKARYLIDGLIGLAENLRGDTAKDFVNALEKTRSRRAQLQTTTRRWQ